MINYTEKAKKFTESYNCEDPHVIQIVESVCRTRDRVGPMGGGFVQAVVDNDLVNTVARADSVCMKYLRVIVAAKEFCH